MLRKRASSIISFAIIILVYILAVFIIPIEGKELPTWIGFGFALGALFISFAVAFIGFLRKGTLEDKFYSLPLISIIQKYLIAQFAVSVALMIIDAFVEADKIPLWIVLLVSIIVTAAALIAFIIAFNVKAHYTETDRSVKESINTFKNFCVIMTGLPEKVSDADVKKKLEKLAEDFRYSDPVSSDATEEVERLISYEVEVLRTAVSGGDYGVITRQAERVSTLLADRNRICKASK